MPTLSALPLAGISVLEIGGGAAAAYCGRLLVDAGAAVTVTALSQTEREQGIMRGESNTERAYGAYLSAGKQSALLADGGAGRSSAEQARAVRQMSAQCREVDLVLVGEGSSFAARLAQPRVAVIDLSWFGSHGPYSGWHGSDLIVQALTGLPQMAGAVDGPPLHAGDRQSTLVAGVTAYIAAVAALWAKVTDSARRFDISILESNLVLSEMHMHFFERDAIPMARYGINRFAPNSPVGVYPCQDGWVGITATTPEQWRSLCVALQMHEQAADASLLTRELRFARLDEVERAMCTALAARSASEWAQLGRQHKVPIVVVPDAHGTLDHPIFNARQALARFSHGDTLLQVPRTPFALLKTPIADRLDRVDAGKSVTATVTTTTTSTTAPMACASADSDAPLAGLSVIDFAMGWAGPLSGLVAWCELDR